MIVQEEEKKPVEDTGAENKEPEAVETSEAPAEENADENKDEQ